MSQDNTTRNTNTKSAQCHKTNTNTNGALQTNTRSTHNATRPYNENIGPFRGRNGGYDTLATSNTTQRKAKQPKRAYTNKQKRNENNVSSAEPIEQHSSSSKKTETDLLVGAAAPESAEADCERPEQGTHKLHA